MPPKEKPILFYGMFGEELQEINTDDLYCTDEFEGQRVDDIETSFTADLDYEKAKKIIPQGMRNGAILKRDGFLDVTNGELD